MPLCLFIGMIRIIPAYAGSTSSPLRVSMPTTDHPRIRGEHESTPEGVMWDTGSSPHTRGALNREAIAARIDRIIPAYAGSTGVFRVAHFFDPDHPRIRGEHLVYRFADQVGEGSSPHTRGALILAAAAAPGTRIIPAYAGSTVKLSYL